MVWELADLVGQMILIHCNNEFDIVAPDVTDVLAAIIGRARGRASRLRRALL
jgi:hypothetical protein